jgi:hypothetical protein
MVAFLREIERRTGRRAMLYGGNRIKEDIGRLSAEDRDYVTGHLLWLCQYGSRPTLPRGFTKAFLWQYTDGVIGPQPRTIPGIKGHVDLNVFTGTRAQLEAVWTAPPRLQSDELSSQSRRADIDGNGIVSEDEQASWSRRGDEDDGTSLPPFLQPTAPSTGGLNVQPQRGVYNLDTEVLQTKLIGLGYHEVGTVDGKWGGKTRGMVTTFMNDRGRPPDGLTTDHGFVNPDARAVVTSEISRAIADGWTRPIAPSRANATEKEIAPKVESVKVSLWGRFTAKIAAGFAAVGLTGSSISSAFQSVQDALYPVRNFFASIPPEVWFILMGVVAGAVWYVTNRTAKASTEDYNTGRLN